MQVLPKTVSIAIAIAIAIAIPIAMPIFLDSCLQPPQGFRPQQTLVAAFQHPVELIEKGRFVMREPP
jgi:hypothetical protein